MRLLQLQQHLARFYSNVAPKHCIHEIDSLICILNAKLENDGDPIDYLPRTVATIEKTLLLAHKLGLTFDQNKRQASVDTFLTADSYLAIVLDIREAGLKHIFSKEPNYDIDVLKFAFDTDSYSVNSRIFDSCINSESLELFNGNVTGGVCALKSKRNDDVLTTIITIAELNEIAQYYNVSNITPHFCYRQLLKRALKTLYTPHHTNLFNLKEALMYQDSLRGNNGHGFKQLSESELNHYL